MFEEATEIEKSINRVWSELRASQGDIFVTVKWKDLQVLFEEWEKLKTTLEPLLEENRG